MYIARHTDTQQMVVSFFQILFLFGEIGDLTHTFSAAAFTPGEEREMTL